jgi:hypothetical protein
MHHLIKKLKLVIGSSWDNNRYFNANRGKIGKFGKMFPRIHYVCKGHVLKPYTITTTDEINQLENRNVDLNNNIFSNIDIKLRNSTNRESFFGELKGLGGLGLEIGPLHAPICRRDTHNIKYIDVCNTEELKTRYTNDPNVPIENIVDVDYVWRGELYGNLISERFDYVVSSHNIEHVPCLIAFLNSLSSCLKVGGKIYLAIPDKRYCFDHFKPESSIAEVLDAYITERKKPLPWHIVRHEMLRTHNNSVKHWKGIHGIPAYMIKPQDLVCGDIPLNGSGASLSPQKISSSEPLLERLKSHYAASDYRDTHVWIMTPVTFGLIMDFLTANLLVSLELTDLFPTESNSHEFYAVLSKI